MGETQPSTWRDEEKHVKLPGESILDEGLIEKVS